MAKTNIPGLYPKANDSKSQGGGGVGREESFVVRKSTPCNSQVVEITA